MIKHILKPNLPEAEVRAIICGTDDKLILSFFDKKGISVLKNAPNTDIDISVSGHADMAAFHIGGDKIILDKNQSELIIKLRELGFYVYEASECIKGQYPDDIRLNFTLIGDYALGNFNFADTVLLRNISDKKLINVKQGYSKCSVLIVDENSAITDDTSICRKMKKNGFDVLLISKGDISLDGHEYGFIGGASGKISKDTVVFFGNVTKHSDFEKIKSFLFEHGCNYICTDNGKLRDIGGFVSLFEE